MGSEALWSRAGRARLSDTGARASSDPYERVTQRAPARGTPQREAQPWLQRASPTAALRCQVPDRLATTYRVQTVKLVTIREIPAVAYPNAGMTCSPTRVSVSRAG